MMRAQPANRKSRPEYLRACHPTPLNLPSGRVPFAGPLFSENADLIVAANRVSRYALRAVSEITRILSAIEQGEPQAAEQLLPLIYDELRRLAAQRLAQEKPGQTLQATSLVHEAYLRLVGVEKAQHWNSRGHFFAAAAEAMRRILVEQARRKGRIKHGGGRQRVALDRALDIKESHAGDLLALNEALKRFETVDPAAAGLVKLRYFAGLTMREAAAALGMTLRSAERNWTYARTWLRRTLAGGP
jgi:RNA polymerase sigma factor (TIGR02999 family)